MVAAGICSTDLELQRGYYGFKGVPGHEFVGEVEAVSSDAPLSERRWIGRRVAGEINLACGKCDWCVRGLGRHCPTRTVLGIVNQPGAFEEYFVLPLRNLHAVPRAIPTEHAVFIEPVAAACEILDQVKFPNAAEVAVLGDGKLGLLIAQVIQASGAQVHLFGRHKGKMRIAAAKGAIPHVVPRDATEKSGAPSKNYPQKAFAYVVDATGSSRGLQTAVSMCEPRGTVILKSTVHDQVSLNTAPVVVDELTLIGSRCGRFEPAIRLLSQGKIDVHSLIEDEFPLDKAPAAFRRAATKGALKILLRPPA